MIVQPTWLGQPLYPFGFPLRPQDIIVQNKTIREIFFGGIISETGETTYSAEDEETLKSFIVYYINAPVFDNDELKQKNLMQMSLDDAIMECMNYGLDPF